MSSLYADPAMYSRIFPVEEEDVAFFAELVGNGEGWLLDAAGGTGELGGRVAERIATRAICLDLEAGLLAGPTAVQGDLRALPLADAAFHTIVSRLFGYGYAVGFDPMAATQLAAELSRVLSPGGVAAMEVPLAWKPGDLVGLEEAADLGGGLRYRFRYGRRLSRTPYGSILSSTISARQGTDEWRLEAPLHVFTPNGVREWLEGPGLRVEAFFAPYDLRTRTRRPPRDVLRAVVLASQS